MTGPTDWSAPQVKTHFEQILEEKDRALEMAADEREKAASALRSEQQRREDQATAERDKAAENLRIEMARSIKEGDERLREHIANQIMQIQAALVSADKLELSRLSALAENTESLRRASADAAAKFEKSVTDRFATVNEFRGSLDDLSKNMATRREMESGISTVSNLVEAARVERQRQIEDLRATLSELRSRLDVGAPQIPELQKFIAATGGRQEGMQLSVGLLFGGLAALATIISVVIVLANVLTGP